MQAVRVLGFQQKMDFINSQLNTPLTEEETHETKTQQFPLTEITIE